MTRCLTCAVLIRSGSRCVPCQRAYRGTWRQTMEWRAAVLAADGYRCRSCGLWDPSGAQLQADHVIPLVQGGAPFGRGQALCVVCHKERTRTAARR